MQAHLYVCKEKKQMDGHKRKEELWKHSHSAEYTRM